MNRDDSSDEMEATLVEEVPDGTFYLHHVSYVFLIVRRFKTFQVINAKASFFESVHFLM